MWFLSKEVYSTYITTNHWAILLKVRAFQHVCGFWKDSWIATRHTIDLEDEWIQIFDVDEDVVFKMLKIE